VKWTKFLYLPDPHGFAVDPKAWRVAMQFKKDYQPDRVVIGGDFMDLRALRKGACDDDLTEQVRPDFDKGIELLNESEATDVILGNHDDRLWQVANSSGVASEFCKYLVEKLEWWARDRGIDLVPYRADSYLELGPQLKALTRQLRKRSFCYEDGSGLWVLCIRPRPSDTIFQSQRNRPSGSVGVWMLVRHLPGV
jgi:hypothetical protein